MIKAKQSKRPTIGLLIDQLTGGYQVGMLQGTTNATRERDANLITLVGGVMHDPDGVVEPDTVLYDLVDVERIDGLLVASGLITAYLNPEEATAFYGRYHPMPVVSLGLALEGIPSVMVENYAGMYDAVAHLIEAHGRRRIAFIRGPEGNEEAEARYRAYADALAKHDIPLDPDLVTPGAFTTETGEAAIGLLLEQRKTDLDAVAAANDYMALGALAVLQAHGLRVPADVAVVGFDDIRESQCTVPLLTTVRQPVHEMGRLGVEMLLAQIAGEAVPEQSILPTQLVTRRSCGCQLEMVTRAAMTMEPAEPVPPLQREDIIAEMARSAKAAEHIQPETARGWATRLLDAFIAGAKADPTAEVKPTGTFLPALDDILRQVMASGSDVAPWQEVISSLRRRVLPHLEGETLSRAEDLCLQARVMVGETAERAQGYQTLQAEQQAQTLRQVGQSLITTFDAEKLMDVLAVGLPSLDIPSTYLSLYEDPANPTEHSRLMLAYDENCRLELASGGQRFPSRHLVPYELLPRQRPFAFVAEPLFFLQDQLGFVLFEATRREENVYDSLRGEISSALQGALLLKAREEAEEALAHAYAEVEKQIQERTVELQREIVEREKAQDEALHLQMEVIEAQKRAIQELSTPIIPVLEGVIVMPLIGSVDSLRARDLTRRLLAGIREHRARVVILDITGVPLVDSGVAAHLNKTIQAARLKGARTIITGISDAVAETIVDLGIDWSGIDTLADLQTGLRVALAEMRRQHYGGSRQ